MPQSDFLIGLNAGSSLVGDVIGDKQRQAQLDLAKAQMEMDRSFKQSAVEQSTADLALRKKMLDEQSKHHRKLEEAQDFELKSATLNRDWKVEDRKSRFDGLTRAKEFDRELGRFILEDPTGVGFFKKATQLRLQYSDLFSHTSDEVQAKAQAIESRGMAFLRSTEVGVAHKELSTLEETGFLNPLEREDQMAVGHARQNYDMSIAEEEAAKYGTTVADTIGEAKAKSPELTSRGNWTPAWKAMVSREIQASAKNRLDMAAAPKAQITLEIPAGAIDPETKRPYVDVMTGKQVSAGKITFDLEEAQRSPYLRSLIGKVSGRSGDPDLFAGGEVRRVRLQNGKTGMMTDDKIKENALRGIHVEVIGNAP